MSYLEDLTLTFRQIVWTHCLRIKNIYHSFTKFFLGQNFRNDMEALGIGSKRGMLSLLCYLARCGSIRELRDPSQTSTQKVLVFVSQYKQPAQNRIQ